MVYPFQPNKIGKKIQKITKLKEKKPTYLYGIKKKSLHSGESMPISFSVGFSNLFPTSKSMNIRYLYNKFLMHKSRTT